MINISTYRQFVKNEMHKIKAVSGVRCGFAPLTSNAGASEGDKANTELLKQTLIANGNCTETAAPGSPCSEIMRRGVPAFSGNPEEQISIQSNHRARHRHMRGNYRNCEYQPYKEYYEWLRRLEYPVTNVYKFENQNFPDNLLGYSNIEITDDSYENNRNALEKAQIEQILQKYGKK